MYAAGAACAGQLGDLRAFREEFAREAAARSAIAASFGVRIAGAGHALLPAGPDVRAPTSGEGEGMVDVSPGVVTMSGLGAEAEAEAMAVAGAP